MYFPLTNADAKNVGRILECSEHVDMTGWLEAGTSVPGLHSRVGVIQLLVEVHLMGSDALPHQQVQ